MIAEKQIFRRKRIQLDGSSFTECFFEECQLHYSGVFGVEMHGCKFSDGCSWHLDGAAAEAVKFMSVLYRSGAVAMVEATFDNIRGIVTHGGPTIQ